MPVTDPIADMLTRIRNAQAVHHETVMINHSKQIATLLTLMHKEGFITSFKPTEQDRRRMLRIQLRYYDDDSAAIHGLKRVSKPGLRVYVGCKDIPRYYGSLGVAFISTSKGLMTGEEARKSGVGGELLFYIW